MRFPIHSPFPRKLRPFLIIYVTRCYLIESISQFPLPPQTSPAAYSSCNWRDRCCCRLGCRHYPGDPSIDPYSHRLPRRGVLYGINRSPSSIGILRNHRQFLYFLGRAGTGFLGNCQLCGILRRRRRWLDSAATSGRRAFLY